MRRIVMGAVLALGLLVGSGPAQAQQPGQKKGAGAFSPLKQLQGVVRQVDLGQGRVVIAASDGAATELRGTPGQLLGLKPGAKASLRYVPVSGQLWLVTEGMTRPVPESVGPALTVTGHIISLSSKDGELTLSAGGRSLAVQTHPMLLSGLRQGQRAQVTFQTLSGVNWATALRSEAEVPRK
ncbi:MAG TPA: hypothetical protein VE057_07110 [Archangium sp.]|nr:hypothetical protein [Archangium sp.]